MGGLSGFCEHDPNVTRAGGAEVSSAHIAQALPAVLATEVELEH